ncbi:MAG: protein translocase subunit SecF, partial [Chloroflexota bacterium]|nr:protein translocase subunit SecF [Chloroflexota bacterium]
MFDIVGRRKWAYIVSAVILVPSILSLVFFRLQLGIDFSGGTIYELRFEATPPTEEIKRIYLSLDLGEPLVQATGEGSVIIRSKELGLEDKQAVRSALEEVHGQAEELRFEAVGPVIARELTQRAIL